MHSNPEIKLTSAEITILWRTFLSDTMSLGVMRYFLNIVKDESIKPILEYAIQTSQEHIQTITEIFNQEGYPIPQGFTDKDVNLTAAPLYDDIFVLFFLRYMARIGLNYYSITLPQMARQDMLDFLTGCVQSATELTRRLIKIKLEKGVYQRPPQIEIPKEIDFVDNRNYTAGFFTEKRSLIAGEVTQLFINTQSNAVGKALLTGFIQGTESAQIKEYLTRGTRIAGKHIEIFSKKLEDEDISAALPPDTFVTDSTEAPFSDKLIMFMLSLINAAGFGDYATAVSTCMRHDIQADFIRLGAEIAKYGADGLNILIDNGWMEQPPQAINHAALAKV